MQNPVGAGGFGLLPFLTERINVLNAKKQDADTCIDAITKMSIQCLEYWDSITKTNLLPENILLDQSYSDTDRLFMVPMLSSRRGTKF